MRIAYICADVGVPFFGRKGCSIHVQEVIAALRSQGHYVELFACSLGDDPPLGFEPIRIHLLPAPGKVEPSAREQIALRANADLLNALEQEGPFDMIYERYSLWSYAGMEYARKIGVPGLLEVNAPLIEEQAEYRRLIDRAEAQRVAETVFKTATALIAVSKEVADYLRVYPATRGRVHVVPNGVNPNRFPRGLPPTCPSRPDSFTVGFLGSLKRWHGLSTLVEAFAIVSRRDPNARLLIVGDGPEREVLVQDLSVHGLLASTHFAGSVAHKEVPGLLASMDIAVAPYSNQSPFYFSPLKVYEYMAAGLAVVASRIGQISQIICDEVNGLLFLPDDPLGAATAMDRLRQDPQLRARLGQAARASVLRNHSWDSVVQRILHIAGATDPAYVLKARG